MTQTPTLPANLDFAATARMVLAALSRRYPEGAALTLLDLHSALAFDARAVPPHPGADSTLSVLRGAQWVPGASSRDNRDCVRLWYSPQCGAPGTQAAVTVGRHQIVTTFLQYLLGRLPGDVPELDDEPTAAPTPAAAQAQAQAQALESLKALEMLEALFFDAIRLDADGGIARVVPDKWQRALEACRSANAQIPASITGLRRQSGLGNNYNAWLVGNAPAIRTVLSRDAAEYVMQGWTSRTHEQDDDIVSEYLNGLVTGEMVTDEILQAFRDAITLDGDGHVCDVDHDKWRKALARSKNGVPDSIAMMTASGGYSAWWPNGIIVLHGYGADTCLRNELDHDALSIASPEAIRTYARCVRTGR